MNIEKQSEVNMKAANLLGNTPRDDYDGVHVPLPKENRSFRDDICSGVCTHRKFDIFTNAQDLIDVVNALLKHKAVILQLDDGRFDWVYYETDTYSMNGGGNCDYSDYKTAVAAAVMEVSNDR